MPRNARVKNGECGIYHVIERGNERKDIYMDDLDRERFIQIIMRNKQKYEFKVYAYCLMSNHMHLLIDSNGSDISQIMKSINISYVIYFNRKYQRCGHLFQDRFKSYYIDRDEYALEVSRYIHLNPVRAGIMKHDDNHQYQWSSYRYYANKDFESQSDVNLSFILGLLSENAGEARNQYIKYVMRDTSECQQQIHNVDELDGMNHDLSVTNYSLAEAELFVRRMAKENGVDWLKIINKKSIYKDLRDIMMKKTRMLSQLSLREIGELFGGLSESTVSKIIAK